MTARLANGGRAVVPHLTRSVGNSVTEKVQSMDVPSLNIPPGHLKLVTDAMNRVVNHPRGTARRSATGIEEFPMAGKTGTVQVRRITKAERDAGVRKNKDLPWRHRDHALFVGFAPVDNPRYAISVVVEHGGGGSSVAAPIAKDVMAEAHRRNSAGPGAGIAGAIPQQSTTTDTRAEEDAVRPTTIAQDEGGQT